MIRRLLIIVLFNVALFEFCLSQKSSGDYFFKSDTVHDIRVTFTQCNYWDSLIYYKTVERKSRYTQANVTVNGKTYYACGIRIKGESSFDYSPGRKKSFKLKFNKFIKKQRLDGITTVNLNNGFKDPSMMREKIFLDIMKREGLPVPRCTYANLYINNENFGLYLLVENINKSFLKYNFGNKKGNLYKGEPQAHYIYFGDDPDSYVNKYKSRISDEENIIDHDLVNFIKYINDTTKSETDYVSKLDSLINTENLIKIFSITSILCNIDAYNILFPHNQYLYFNTSENKFEWIPYDANYAFCAWSPVFTLSQAEELSLFHYDSKYDKPLLDAIFEKKAYRNRYLDYSKDFLKKYTPLKIYFLTDSIALKIRKYVYQDSMKMYTSKEFEINLKETIGDPKDAGAFIPGIVSFYKKRRKFLLKEIKEKR